jgi:subtilisin-like proprotein convertase family protein
VLNFIDQKVGTFIGENITGDWNLVIADFAEGDSGALLKWVVEIKYCGDGEVTSPEECDSGSNCTAQCTCEQDTRPDPNTLGACVANGTERTIFSLGRCHLPDVFVPLCRVW